MTDIAFEQKHPRGDAGKFAAKEGTESAVTLEATSSLQDLAQEDIRDVLGHLKDGYMKREDGQKLIDYANDPNTNQETDALLTEAADAAEDWNFHYTSLRISAGQGIRAWKADPDAQLTQVSSIAYDENAPEVLLERIYEESGYQHGFASNPAAPPEALLEGVKSYTYFDDKFAENPNTPSEALDIIAERTKGGRWNEELRANPNISARLARKIDEEEGRHTDWAGGPSSVDEKPWETKAEAPF